MSRQKKRRKSAKSRSSIWESPRLAGLLQTALGLWLLLSLTGDSPGWWDVLQDRRAVDLFSTANPGGPVGGLAAFALRLLQYVRDESHRFAQHYHHLLRRKKTLGE